MKQALACAIALIAGCYKANIHVADVATTQRSAVDDQMHMSALGGLVNLVLGTYVPVLGVINPTVDCAKVVPAVAVKPTPEPPKPSLDPDGDGIIGDADKCPNEPETKNGFEDEDGCPDEVI